MLYKPLYFFSDWIIIWFILYKLDIIKYNPILFILLGIFENILWFILCFKHNKLYDYKFVVLVVHFIIKLAMFNSLKDTIITKNDITFSMLLYIVYSIWLKNTHKTTNMEHYKFRIKEITMK